MTIFILVIIIIVLFTIMLYMSTKMEQLENKIKISDYEYNLIRSFRKIQYEFQFANHWLRELAHGNKIINTIVDEIIKEEK